MAPENVCTLIPGAAGLREVGGAALLAVKMQKGHKPRRVGLSEQLARARNGFSRVLQKECSPDSWTELSPVRAL